MPIMTLKNPYKGINAHLHSIAQNPKDEPTIWTSIHASLIGHIVDFLNKRLPLNYIARAEQSLQIKADDSDKARRPRPDGSIYQTGVSDTTLTVSSSATSELVRVVPIGAFDEDNFLSSAVIRRVEDNTLLGDLVTRIELLSPFNKIGGDEYERYLANRRNAIYSLTSLIELDLLHQSASPIPSIAQYPDDEDSHPYTIAVTDMRAEHNPQWVTVVHIVDVDLPLPDKVDVPLADDDFLEFDFNAVYQHMFSIGRWGTNVDYAKLPRKFETYCQADQERINAVMERAKELSDAE